MNACRFVILVLFAGVSFAPAAALAQAPKAKAPAGGDAGDLWEITTKMEMAGMPMAMPAQTHRMCLGKQASDDQFVPRNEDCRVTESRRSGNTLRYKMACTGKNPMTGEGEITYAKDTYSGRMRMTGKMEGESVDMTHTYSGRRMGDCTGTVQNQVAKALSDGAEATAEVCRKGIEAFATDYFFQPNAPCEGQRGAFCAEVSKVAATAREPAGYTAMRTRNANMAPAFSACNQDFVAVTRAACTRAGETRNLEFVGSGACDDDVRRIGEAGCRGRSFTSIEPSMRGVCSRYAAITRGQGTANVAAQPQPVSAPKPADPMQQGLDAVRKLLPF